MNFDLQLFSERNLKNQTSNQLRKGIRSLNKRIEEHFAKIANPEKYYSDWNVEKDKQAGRIGHWQHEIKKFAESIQSRIDELAKRGELP